MTGRHAVARRRRAERTEALDAVLVHVREQWHTRPVSWPRIRGVWATLVRLLVSAVAPMRWRLTLWLRIATDVPGDLTRAADRETAVACVNQILADPATRIAIDCPARPTDGPARPVGDAEAPRRVWHTVALPYACEPDAITCLSTITVQVTVDALDANWPHGAYTATIHHAGLWLAVERAWVQRRTPVLRRIRRR